MNMRRYTDNHTVNFLKFVVGLRRPATSVSLQEHRLLARLAGRSRCTIEVGVFEGATSQIFCEHAPRGSIVYLVDPFFPEVYLERLLNLSFTGWIANKVVEPWRERVRFIRKPSTAAAAILAPECRADLIFIDARHDYQSVCEDFRCWAPILDQNGTIAFHDSRVCPARPDLSDEDGPVRLMREIEEGKHRGWNIVDTADSVTLVRRTPMAGGAS